jgi:hypothetical protein
MEKITDTNNGDEDSAYRLAESILQSPPDCTLYTSLGSSGRSEFRNM